jgi:hypothetical protein
MSFLNRRQFVLSTASAAALSATRTGWAQTSAPANAVFMIDPTKPVAHVPADFTGLSYESSQLSHPSFFSASNTALVAFFKTLGKTGILRLGGNLSEFTSWSPTDPAETNDAGTEGPDPGKRGADVKFVISPRSIKNLDSFLQATGWTVIYGLNLAGGTAESAALEAACVAQVCGPRLVAFQFGNEPDLFKHNGDPKDRWSYDEFISKWKTFEKAVRAAVPNAPLAGPDTSFKPEWVGRFIDDTQGQAKLVTAHYYAEGPPTNPDMTIHRLLTDKTKFASNIATAAKLAQTKQLPYRMSEGNTCYNAGKKGVSDTFASALWAGDFLAQVATIGGVGVNLHGGGNGFYTPIAGSKQEGFTARPDYYGMMMARSLAGATLLQSSVDAAGSNVTAYAMQKHGKLTVLAFNKDEHPVTLEIKLPKAAHAELKVMRLSAAAIDATTGVTLGGAEVKADGSWTPNQMETIQAKDGQLLLTLPAYSGASASFV